MLGKLVNKFKKQSLQDEEIDEETKKVPKLVNNRVKRPTEAQRKSVPLNLNENFDKTVKLI